MDSRQFQSALYMIEQDNDAITDYSIDSLNGKFHESETWGLITDYGNGQQFNFKFMRKNYS